MINAPEHIRTIQEAQEAEKRIVVEDSQEKLQKLKLEIEA